MLLVITSASNGMVPLQNLETMEIGECKDLQYLFVIEGCHMHENEGGLLPVLCRLHLHELNELRGIIGLNHPKKTLSFEMLKRLEVCSCKKLRYLLPLYVLHNLWQLEHIEIKKCETLERVFGDERDEGDEGESKTDIDEVKLRLKCLILEELPQFTGCCQDRYRVKWLSLESVRVVKCDQLKKSLLGKLDSTILSKHDALADFKVNEYRARANNNEDTESIIKYLFDCPVNIACPLITTFTYCLFQ